MLEMSKKSGDFPQSLCIVWFARRRKDTQSSVWERARRRWLESSTMHNPCTEWRLRFAELMSLVSGEWTRWEQFFLTSVTPLLGHSGEKSSEIAKEERRRRRRRRRKPKLLVLDLHVPLLPHLSRPMKIELQTTSTNASRWLFVCLGQISGPCYHESAPAAACWPEKMFHTQNKEKKKKENQSYA
jgi:hypothetical protein